MSIIATPPAFTGIWVVDPVHSRIGFAVKHLGINTVRGRFDDFEGTLELTDGFGTAIVTGVIEAASVDTRFAMRDEHLRSPDFFDVESHPKISFVSTAIAPIGGERFEPSGEITIRGVTKTIVLEGDARHCDRSVRQRTRWTECHRRPQTQRLRHALQRDRRRNPTRR